MSLLVLLIILLLLFGGGGLYLGGPRVGGSLGGLITSHTGRPVVDRQTVAGPSGALSPSPGAPVHWPPSIDVMLK